MVTEFGHHVIKTLGYGRNGRLRATVTLCAVMMSLVGCLLRD